MLMQCNRKQVIQHGGAWLRRFPWQWFITLTFRRSTVTTSLAEKYFKDYIENCQPEAIYFFVIEKHSASGCPHIHALIGNVEGLAAWKHGISKILPYDSALGAAYYVTKFLTAPSVWWDIVAKPSDLLSSTNPIT